MAKPPMKSPMAAPKKPGKIMSPGGGAMPGGSAGPMGMSGAPNMGFKKGGVAKKKKK